jgi:glycerate 2-kinase
VTRFLVAPDSFKGTFTAVQVAAAIGRGVRAAGAEADLAPVGDGGEGTMEVLGGRLVAACAHDPLGREIEASFSLLQDGRAMVETAAASGLALLAPDELDPWNASTFGTGELIVAAARAGASEILVGVGGSATMDGGRGAIEAIGSIDVPLVVLSDVETTWERCAEIYGPQKGADAVMVNRLRERFEVMASSLPRDPRGVPMTGAAGALSGGLWAAFGAELRAGAPYVLDTIGFDERLARADAVIVGEGRLDEQSAMGKIVGEIAGRARRAGVPVHAIVGSVRGDAGLDSVIEATTLAELEAAGARLADEFSRSGRS